MIAFHYCRTTFTPVPLNGMRPGYDCRCSGCMAHIGKSLDEQVARELARQQGGR